MASTGSCSPRPTLDRRTLLSILGVASLTPLGTLADSPARSPAIAHVGGKPLQVFHRSGRQKRALQGSPGNFVFEVGNIRLELPVGGSVPAPEACRVAGLW